MSRRSNVAIEGELVASSEKPLKQVMAEALRFQTKIARFKGATIIENEGRWVDMSSERFAGACYKLFGDGLTKSRVGDLEHLFRSTATDLSSKAHLIAFGSKVWDTRKLTWSKSVAVTDCVYRVDYEPVDSEERIQFLLDLACGDEGVYDDIMQSVAPLIMDKKPTGVIWYLGSGANGKSTLVHLLYKIFGDFLTELTVKQLEDERDTPQLNGKLGNVCKESSEGFVEDTRTYKSIGTHESFAVHKFHSQDMVQIEGNVHHIFSANNIPTFGDKSYGARRRTLVIPFENRFRPDEMFEDKTFTDKFIARFVGELIKYALILKEQGYEYKFSTITRTMKEKYDTDANTAQTYADELVWLDIVGFGSYTQLEQDYSNWCSDHGYKNSSINVLRRAMDEKGFERKSVRVDEKIVKMYLLEGAKYTNVKKVDGRLGIYQKTDSPHADDLGRLGEAEKQSMLAGW